MSASLRKGWCPGALRPMMARDGLIVRLRITGGILPRAAAVAIADLSQRHGNSLLDLSARANLQLRGIRETALPALWDGLSTLGLLDDDAASEAVRNVVANPLAGHGGDRPDIRRAVVDLEAALVADPALRDLPPKFGVLVDDGGAPHLGDIAADLRFDWDGDRFRIGFAGTVTDCLPLGFCGLPEIASRAVAIARLLVTAPCGPMRATAFVDAMGRDAVFAALGGSAEVAAMSPKHLATRPPDLVGPLTLRGTRLLGVAAPFGRLDATMLRTAARFDIRLTPWRILLLPEAEPAALPALAEAGFIVDPTDPRLRVAACTGAAGCERGTTDTHRDAARLAPLAADAGGGIALHVSGCAKGCAHPRRAPVTLVARGGRYDVVRGGRPGDVVEGTASDLADVARLMRIADPAGRAPGRVARKARP